MTSLPWKDWEQKTGLPHVPVLSRAPPPPRRHVMHYLTRIPFGGSSGNDRF